MELGLHHDLFLQLQRLRAGGGGGGRGGQTIAPNAAHLKAERDLRRPFSRVTCASCAFPTRTASIVSCLRGPSSEMADAAVCVAQSQLRRRCPKATSR